MEDGIGAWEDDEAKPLIRQIISFTDKGVKLGDKFCAGKTTKVLEAKAKNLTTDLKGVFCGEGKISTEVYDISLSCDDKVRFTPYIVKLTNGKYLGFGDGIMFCLIK